MITPDRQKQIDEATPENPVDLTTEEETELRLRNKIHFQWAIGSARYRVKAKPDTPASQIWHMKSLGFSNPIIANELKLHENTVHRILERTYA